MTKMSRKQLRALIQEAAEYIDINTLSGEDVMTTKAPLYDTGFRSPEKRLLDKLGIRDYLDSMNPEELEALADGDEEVMSLIHDIKNNAMLDDPRLNR